MKIFKPWGMLLSVALVFSGCGINNEYEKNYDLNVQDEPTILTYGYIDAYDFQDLDSSINEQIVSFNRKQDEYYIEIVKYGNDNYDEGLKALNADISAGKAPDIIEVYDEELLNQLGEKQVIDDLYTYIDNGEGPKHEDFLRNVLNSFEHDGKLYGLTPLFKIQSLVGNPTYISTDEITHDQLVKLLAEYSSNDGIEVCNALTKGFVLSDCILTSLDEFVDMDNHSCNFQNEKFKELLEFSMQFDSMGPGGNDLIAACAKLQQNELCLYNGGVIGGFQDYTLFRELTGENGFDLLGFPSINGCTPQITTNFPFFTINSESEHKDVAWQFLCTFLDDRYLTDKDVIDTRKGFPVTKSGFDRMAKMAMMTYELGGESSRTNPQGITITYPLYSTSEEEVEYIREIINEIKPITDYGEIESIICEEIEYYWSGSKTIDEVVEVIQNRSQLYLSELE